ncbi:methyltransferase domain-containing protein [Pseudomonas sp. L-22-4S-12]|uniref:class I SAM-dependent methyltransferase n=1 Tax=Pseudomonas sp. L-22-4S-12 TaxID=2610893 RepID=UPI00132AF6E6|nr:class I SAM-dependent methyltransferase [Pseudomonas sp. L-22-4S-12]MWV14954.1 methyltransferase domain-containing protein [Pseudomonas sp. L-22-4S-12]
MLSKLKNIFSRTAVPHDSAGSAPAALNSVPEAEMDSTLTDTYLSGWFRHETGELFEGFMINPEDSILDIGCGDGPFAHFCAERGAEVIFADIDATKVAAVSEMLKHSKARAILPLVTDAKPIPLADNRVSKVIAMEVLEHVEDPRDFMRELVRVAKPGCLFLLTVPDPVGENVQRTLAPPSYFEPPNHIRVFERTDFERLVVEAGLVIERRTSYGFYWSLWWFFFWACKQDLSPPWHPLLQSWTQTWNLLLSTPDGPRIKRALDDAMPKSQAIIARKPFDE